MKKLLPALIIFLAVFLAAFLLLKKFSPSNPENQAVNPENTVQKLKDLLGSGESYKCTWKVDDQNYGTSYVKERKMYAEVTGAGQTSKMISKNNCLYSWQDGGTDGVKFCQEPTEQQPEQAENFAWESNDLHYQCSPERVDDRLFETPANVNFLDAQEMMKGFDFSQLTGTPQILKMDLGEIEPVEQGEETEEPAPEE